MTQDAVLITGACGEIGQALLKNLAAENSHELVTVDLKPLPEELEGKSTHIMCDLLDKELYRHLSDDYQFGLIYHMAAMLSTTAEYKPQAAHNVNAGGTIDLLSLAADQSAQTGDPVKFIFPSSIAVYGLPDLETKNKVHPVREIEWTQPTTMYGCTKLYCEKTGRYFSENYLQLSDEIPTRLDFRALRFPGLISAFTIPSGGTSDYGPEMVHSAAKGETYNCFVRADVKIPFMAMSDAVRSLQMLAAAPIENLTSRIYNVTSFSLSAAEFKELVLEGFPEAEINFVPDTKRQAIVDTWPAEIDDSTARRDWGWKPEFDARRTCQNYLLPNIRKRYA
jgi:nucleoside-diphosphate-sugar epimerase